MLLYILDESYEYGCEFYGAAPAIGLTPLTERCFLSMSQAITQCKGASLCGASGVGKTETVKVTVFTINAYNCIQKGRKTAQQILL